MRWSCRAYFANIFYMRLWRVSRLIWNFSLSQSFSFIRDLENLLVTLLKNENFSRFGNPKTHLINSYLIFCQYYSYIFTSFSNRFWEIQHCSNIKQDYCRCYDKICCQNNSEINTMAICYLANDFQTISFSNPASYFYRFQFVILRDDDNPWLMISILLITCPFDRGLIL